MGRLFFVGSAIAALASKTGRPGEGGHQGRLDKSSLRPLTVRMPCLKVALDLNEPPSEIMYFAAISPIDKLVGARLRRFRILRGAVTENIFDHKV